MIEIKNITKVYGDKKVVNNLSFNIEKGKITSLIGPNGAGKSTALSMITRLVDLDEGEVIIEGKEISLWNKKELAKKISILRQANNINISLKVRELVSFGRFPYSEGNLTEDDNRAINEAIEYMNLKEIEDKFLDELSGGQRQRAYIAMVIAQETDYIFLDEPLNNLDMNNSSQMMKTLEKLAKEKGKTIVIVIHDINFASCYSDYIIAMKAGKLEREGTIDNVIDKEVLSNIYEMNFDVQNIMGKKISLYF
ncbi:MAG: ABC transporter ATP-binding protein [Sarcina sp.]